MSFFAPLLMTLSHLALHQTQCGASVSTTSDFREEEKSRDLGIARFLLANYARRNDSHPFQHAAKRHAELRMTFKWLSYEFYLIAPS
jgi:hypothetical protein